MRRGKSGNSGRRATGFTLLELVLALLLIGLLVGMVFTTAHSSLVLGNTVVKTQNEEMLRQAFFDFLENRLGSLPGNTRLELTSTDSPSHYLSDLTLENVPVSFTWGGDQRIAKAVQLSTVLRRSGFLDIVLRYYENEIIDPASENTSGTGFGSTAASEEPFAEIVLLSDVRFFEWRVLDGRDPDEYGYEWDLPGRMPLHMELVCAFGARGETIRHVFWLPARQNPEVFMRQMQRGAGGGGRADGGGDGETPSIPGGGGTEGGNPIRIQPGGRTGGNAQRGNR